MQEVQQKKTRNSKFFSGLEKKFRRARKKNLGCHHNLGIFFFFVRPGPLKIRVGGEIFSGPLNFFFHNFEPDKRKKKSFLLRMKNFFIYGMP